VVHCHGLTAGLAAAWARRGLGAARLPPLLVTAHIQPVGHWHRTGWRLLARLHPRLEVVAVSRSVEQDLAGILPRTVVIHRIPNGLDRRWLASPLHRERSPVDEKRKVRLLAAARLVRDKGLDILLRALAGSDTGRTGNAPLFPSGWKLVVAGDGPERARLGHLAGKLDLSDRVEFVGWQGDTLPMYDRADIVVLPSRREAAGISVMEAMARGCAVVASDAGGMPELVEDGVTGTLVPAGDVTALAIALSSLMRDPALRRRLGASARQRAEAAFSWDRPVQSLYRTYENLAGRSGKA